jgi:hypothetical protein
MKYRVIDISNWTVTVRIATIGLMNWTIWMVFLDHRHLKLRIFGPSPFMRLKLPATQQSFSFRVLGVFAFQLAVEDQARIGGLPCRVSAGDGVLWRIEVGMAAYTSSNTRPPAHRSYLQSVGWLADVIYPDLSLKS